MGKSSAHDTAIGLLRAAVDKSKRKEQVPFPKEFLRSSKDRPPLARMIHGGRGGEVRLKLYLTITMMATAEPFDLQKTPSPSRWGRLLSLDGPSVPRRVTSNLNWLRDNKFISLTQRPGTISLITVLDPAGTGAPYRLPSQHGTPYISLPLGLWTHGWILDLSATALALFMVVRDVQLEHSRGGVNAAYLSQQDRAAYGLSADTWTRATKELQSHGLLDVTRVPQGGDWVCQTSGVTQVEGN
ncbi:hypothetical protein V1227_16790 [Lentzea sp. DG1S-22]|uniref:hypothetical protein n=1 Tax=Lentzea sp. DG1S-22 TaxID=3108822 RepID=UPI002E777597|nr:hypothetical protein [Lentzea sp. DG1S-22]WVH84331.1 hypothetical protein V1227_16790 [Lentzea sp. DG1S-22]